MFYRIQEHSRVLVKKPASSAFTVDDPSVITTYLKDYTEFLQFLESLAFSSLCTDIEAEQDDQSRFSRRISALTLIELLYMPLAIPNHSYSEWTFRLFSTIPYYTTTNEDFVLLILNFHFSLLKCITSRTKFYTILSISLTPSPSKIYILKSVNH